MGVLLIFRGGWDVFGKLQTANSFGIFPSGIEFLTSTILGSLGEEPSSGSLGEEPSPVISTFSPLFRDPCSVFCFSLGDETCF